MALGSLSCSKTISEATSARILVLGVGANNGASDGAGDAASAGDGASDGASDPSFSFCTFHWAP